jgi:competence protein ComEC
MLIDAGNDNDGIGLVSYLTDPGIDHFDVLVATHPHEDHIGGMDEIINAFGASVIFMPDVQYDSKNYNDMLYAIEKNHVEIVYPNVMDTFSLDGILFTVLSPASDYYDDLNDYSIVLRMDYNDISFLFTGDAETKAETEMRTNDNLNLDVDVLKASLHGSGTSSTAQFVYKAGPRYVVISVGANNSYGHPDNIVLNRFITYGVEEIYISDKDGTIIAVTNGSSIAFSTIDTDIDGRGSTGAPAVTTPAVTTPVVTTSATTTAPITSTKTVEIVKVDKKAEIVTIRNNTSNDINMTGWRLVSVKGNQVFNFPANYILKANSTVTISSGDSAGDLQWTKANVWNNSESDPAELYNGTVLIDRWDD